MSIETSELAVEMLGKMNCTNASHCNVINGWSKVLLVKYGRVRPIVILKYEKVILITSRVTLCSTECQQKNDNAALSC